jgi:TolA-binding protein
MFLKSLIVTIACLLAVACVKSDDHTKLESRVAALEQFRGEVRRALKADLSRAENLSEQLKEAIKEYRQSTANMQARLDDHDQADRSTKGHFEEIDFLARQLSKKIGRVARFLDTRFGFSSVDLPEDLPKTAVGLLKVGEELFAANNYPLARAVMRKFLADFGNNNDAPRATLIIGETYRKESKYKPALKAYQDIWANHKDHEVAPKSLLYAGHALRDSNECKKAMQMYKFLFKALRKTPEAQKAKALYKQLKKSCK